MPNLYIIAADPETLRCFNLSDVDEALEYAGLTRRSYTVSDMADTNDFQQTLEKAGFTIQIPENAAPATFIIGPMTNEAFEKAQADFFEADLTAMRQTIARMTPQEFSTVYALSQLREHLDNPLGDYVWLDMGTGGRLYTRNEAIRHIYPRYTYYVHQKVLLIK